MPEVGGRGEVRWRLEGKRVFVYCTKTYKLVELYRIVQGGRKGEETVCGADCGCGGVEDAAEFARGAGRETGEGGASAVEREIDPAALCDYGRGGISGDRVGLRGVGGK